MSTELVEVKDKNSVMWATRFCGPATNKDRVMVQISIAKHQGILDTEWVHLDREQWVKFRDVVDAGFAEFPIK